MANMVGKDKLAAVKAGLSACITVCVCPCLCIQPFDSPLCDHFSIIGRQSVPVISFSLATCTTDVSFSVLAEATKFSYEADTLRSMHEGLETQMKSLKARLASSVSKSEFEAEVAESAKLREELRLLQKTTADLEPLEALMQALAAPPRIPVVHATELVLAVRALHQNSLVETTELIKCMAGRVLPVAPSDVEELVLALDGPPARSVSEAIRVLRAMDSRWKTDEVELLLHECQGIGHLREILGANGDLEGILVQEKTKRIAAQEELQMLKDNLAPSAPIFDPPGAKFTGAVTITISSDNRSDTIYCTADGSHPTETHHQVRVVLGACSLGHPLSPLPSTSTTWTSKPVSAP